MARDPSRLIVITDGYWKHIRSTRVYHRHYPEIQGEGASFTDAAAHLSHQLARAIDSVHGRAKRDGIVTALADLEALRVVRPVRRAACRDTVAALGPATDPTDELEIGVTSCLRTLSTN